VYFDGVRVTDELRVGDVDGGWAVLRDRLDVEHGLGSAAVGRGLQPPSVRTSYATLLAQCVDAVHEWSWTACDDGRPLAERDDVRYRLGLAAIEAEAALSAPGHYGRVAESQALIDGSARLLELLGPNIFPDRDAPGPDAARLVERAHRFAQGTAIYGGTLEIFHNIIAQSDLKLPRPAYPV
jgi:alkylation response protein AidB-like acyl-CoA dehydrogenase